MLKVDISSILSFYDTLLDARPHSNAIKTVAGEELGFALLLHYFKAARIDVELLPNAATSKGSWLDGWVVVRGNPNIYYQVEVKSWSMHGYGGRKQMIVEPISDNDLVEYKKRVWASYWHCGRFKDPKVNKVLKRMTPPVANALVEPVACLWSAVHDQGKEEPFFSVCPTSDSDFEKVNVFSMSSHLRMLRRNGVTSITLEMPVTEKRIEWLNALYQRQ